MVYEFELTDEEFRRAWLAEYFRRPALPILRGLAGLVLIGLGIQTSQGATELTARGIGMAAIVLGMWQLLRPFLLVRALLRARRDKGAASQRMRVRIDESGVGVSDGAKETQLDWGAITAAGRGKGYVWFEVRGSARGTIPTRVIDDDAALVEVFTRHGTWRG
ncbi:hypothetical protein [Sandaracinus amylolyticus]|uniref:YcxB-like protein domain-containing protein n=1 Tax=Sandaracinus amylolyticus TaxID=927083 RepID=A0A0F6W0U5_9BACT|nr:hypothetical protein [Sandaracinus amylolyticus]AKF04618.1 hypothetical protein DB32_001767 [Sandaracinus amylolyticus]